ncbi:MAG: aminotransferase class I/II-fold pyridoxal phosphate-dependent enzyme [Candidatus Methanofastidiosia archaeon]
MKSSKRCDSIEYAIREVVIPASKLERKGTKIIKLNIGDPNKFDFSTPQHMLDALCKSAKTADMGYTASEGYPELREEILKFENNKNSIDATPDDILVTSGVSESIQMLFGASLSPKDSILIPGPAYPPYTSLTRFFEATPIIYGTSEEKNWICDIDDIRKKVDKNTRAFVLINPNNPTGALTPKKVIKEIVDFCGENNLFLISDEIYDRIVFEGKHYSPVSLKSDVPIVLLNGFSKVYLVPGWRIGYMVFQDPQGYLREIKEGVKKQARLRLCSNAPCQKACIEALRGPQDHVRKMVSKLKERRDYMHKRINEIEGLECAKPQGAFYMFPKITHPSWKDDKSFVLDVLNNCHVLFVHGSGFDRVYGKMHFRTVFLPPIPTIEKALSKVESYLSSCKK